MRIIYIFILLILMSCSNGSTEEGRNLLEGKWAIIKVPGVDISEACIGNLTSEYMKDGTYRSISGNLVIEGVYNIKALKFEVYEVTTSNLSYSEENNCQGLTPEYVGENTINKVEIEFKNNLIYSYLFGKENGNAIVSEKIE